MKFISQIVDAMKFTLRDWKAIILLGIILCIASTSEHWDSNYIIIYYSIYIISIALIFIEEGYRYKIIEGTLQGDNKPPNIMNLRDLIKDGFLETVTILVYIAILLIFNMITDKLIPKLNLSNAYSLVFVILAVIVYLAFFGFGIYKALNGGKFFSGFNIPGIFRLYFKMGILQTIFLIIVGSISMNLTYSCVLDLGIFRTYHILDFIISFILNPILLLFMTRLIALCGREVNPS